MTRSAGHARYTAMIALIERTYGPAAEPIGAPGGRHEPPRGAAIQPQPRLRHGRPRHGPGAHR
jgi:hypothetical protein